MEAVFSRFDSFDFAADRRFQDGLKVLQQRPQNNGGSAHEDKVLDMKLFFYNRFVEPIDGVSYKQWSSASPQVSCRVEQQLDQTTPPSGPDCDVSDHLAGAAETPAEAETEVTQLSFAEVMRLIQEGQEVPGALKLDIKPSNQSPTPSQMERVLKPWEVASASK